MTGVGYIFGHTIGNTWNGWRNRKHREKMNQISYQQKKELQDIDLNHKKKLQVDRHHLLKEEIVLKGKIDSQNNRDSFIYKHNKEKSGVGYITGDLKNKIFPNLPPPYLIFDTQIRKFDVGKEKVQFNTPMLSLFETFQEQNKYFLDNLVTVESHNAHFKSSAEVKAFYYEEFSEDPVVIVYSTDDGNFLRIYALYGGMTFNDFIFNESGDFTLSKSEPVHECLAKIQRSFLIEKKVKLNSKSKYQSFNENFLQEILNFIANTSIQSIFDNYFSITKDDYKPLTGELINSYKEKIMALGLIDDDFNTIIEQHKTNFLEQTSYVQEKKLLHRIKLINNLK